MLFVGRYMLTCLLFFQERGGVGWQPKRRSDAGMSYLSRVPSGSICLRGRTGYVWPLLKGVYAAVSFGSAWELGLDHVLWRLGGYFQSVEEYYLQRSISLMSSQQ